MEKAMVGVRQFDEDVVLERAMRLFWDQGYGAVSMADLAAATGVQRGSLYNAYGGKEAMLLRALDRYAEQQGAPVHEALNDSDPYRAMARFLDAHLARMAEPSNPTGCLMCQTGLECGGREALPAAFVKAHFERVENALCDTLERGRLDGYPVPLGGARALARYVLGVSRGMAVLHRVYGDLEPVRDMHHVALGALIAN